MKKLFLHIGTGKTGSTSIQKTFENRSNEFHFDYDMTGPNKLRDVDAFIERINSNNNDLVVYSNEWLFRADRKHVEELSLKLKRYFETEVILYLRRQDEFEISRYQQIGKSGDGPTNGGVEAFPNIKNPELDYLKIADKWSEFFKLNVRIFGRDSLVGGDVVLDFSKIIGVQILPEDIIRENYSVGMIKSKIGHLINLNNLSEIRQYVLSGIPDSPKALPSKSMAIKFYRQYEGLNKVLKERYLDGHADFSSNFDFYPDFRTDLWEEDSANKAVIYLLTLISDLLEEKRNR